MARKNSDRWRDLRSGFDRYNGTRPETEVLDLDPGAEDRPLVVTRSGSDRSWPRSGLALAAGLTGWSLQRALPLYCSRHLLGRLALQLQGGRLPESNPHDSYRRTGAGK